MAVVSVVGAAFVVAFGVEVVAAVVGRAASVAVVGVDRRAIEVL